MNIPLFPCFKAHRNGGSAQSVTKNVWTQVTILTTEVYDSGYFASNAWTPPAGKITLRGACGHGGNMAAASAAGVAIYKDGAPFLINWVYSAANNANCQIGADDIATGSNVYTLWGYNPSNSSPTFGGAIDGTFFCGHWFSP